MLVTEDHQTDEMLQASKAQLTYRYFETFENAEYYLRNRKPQATTHEECLITCEVTIQGILFNLTIVRNSKLHFFGNSSKIPDDLQKRMRAPIRQVMVNRLMRPIGIRHLERGSDRTASPSAGSTEWGSNSAFGTRSSSSKTSSDVELRAVDSRNFLLGRHLFEVFQTFFIKKKREGMRKEEREIFLSFSQRNFCENEESVGFEKNYPIYL